jgi:Ca2+-binding RTX toxin-like protein
MAIVNGTNSADSLAGTDGADTISGLGGNDTLKGMGGADRLDGGAGIDTAFYSESGDGVTVNLAIGRGFRGTAEGDTLFNIENVYGSGFNDILIGDDDFHHGNALSGLNGNDILSGGDGRDTLDGGSGNDILKGGGGDDTLIGGDGIDTINYDESFSGLMVWLAQGVSGYYIFLPDGGSGWVTEDHFSGIENVVGTRWSDALIGDDGQNMLLGGAGADALDGRAGEDTASYDGSTSGVQVSLATGSGLGGDAQGDTLFNIENLLGSAFGDLLTGDGNANKLIGGGGNDEMFGGNGGDLIDGGAGANTARYDTSSGAVQISLVTGIGMGADAQGDALINIHNLVGSAFGDVLTGDGNVNRLLGGGGADVLSGGGSNDAFVFSPGQANGDTVTDFVGNGAGAGDSLEFIGYGAGATFTQIDATHWQVNYNANTQHDVITFSNGATIDPTDFLFV